MKHETVIPETDARINPIDYLPHRYPFVFVDKVTKLDSSCIEGEKYISHSEQYLQGHFPGMPMMPGVLMIEALAQLGSIWVRRVDKDTSSIYVLAGVERVRFKRSVVPGDVLRLQADSLVKKGALYKFRAEARVGNALACSAIILSYQKKQDQL